jgi:hypothetical protein
MIPHRRHGSRTTLCATGSVCDCVVEQEITLTGDHHGYGNMPQVQGREEASMRILWWEYCPQDILHRVPRERKDKLSHMRWQGLDTKARIETIIG